MNQSECLAAIYLAADQYNANLLNNNLLFVYQERPNLAQAMETAYRDYNFMHLTGVYPLRDNDISASKFFENCLERRLDLSQFKMRDDGTTSMKLSILPKLLNPSLSAKAVGVYRGGRIELVTDRLVGGVKGSVGFVQDRGFYFPNTVLKGDIRDNIDRSRRILAVFRKKIDDEMYKERTYLAKKVDLSKLNLPKDFEYLKDIEPVV